MNPLGFKRSVLVHALTLRVVAERTKEGGERFKIAQAKELPWFEHRADDWPGEPVLLEWDLPKGPRYELEPSVNGDPLVRWRRHLLDQPTDGVVIGSCWRIEGVLSDGTLVGPRRAINLYEVALRPPLRTSRALVVLVHPHDIQIFDEHERGVPAPTRVGIGGRLGGH